MEDLGADEPVVTLWAYAQTGAAIKRPRSPGPERQHRAPRSPCDRKQETPR
ncbi:hypothetical protein [Novosphingobium sp. ZW T3_23]|uniref:hypothetical protein n=1 Tax=Novosphingobium sp. ZW T3_23 TaxID=3378084 RepID=UPI00385256E8